MAQDWVEIANSAIIKIGGATLMSLDDGTKEANTCKLRIDPVKRIVLRMHPWNCAIDRKTLAPSTTSPSYGYQYASTLPATCLRVLDVADDVPYRIEGRTILSDSSALAVRFIDNIQDPTKVDELLGEAIACYLAWDICYAITQKNEPKQDLWKSMTIVLRQAKTVDAQEERDYEVEADGLLAARVGGFSPSRANR